ncbi:unnamed protein product [Rotaria magnacalcarata]|nr:unnamed protein product [Rotaria magnacalcarata]
MALGFASALRPHMGLDAGSPYHSGTQRVSKSQWGWGAGRSLLVVETPRRGSPVLPVAPFFAGSQNFLSPPIWFAPPRCKWNRNLVDSPDPPGPRRLPTYKRMDNPVPSASMSRPHLSLGLGSARTPHPPLENF